MVPTPHVNERTYVDEVNTIARLGIDPDRRAEREEAGGIIIPDTAQERPEEGEVLTVGTGRLIEDKDSKEKIKKKTCVKTTLQPGEYVLYKKYVAKKVDADDEKLVLVREEDVLGTRLA
jgi:chaperonin GroES